MSERPQHTVWAGDRRPDHRPDTLAIARNLARIYADVLQEPLPAELANLITRYESRAAGRP